MINTIRNILGVCYLLLTCANADTITWDNGASSSDWNDPINWTQDVVPWNATNNNALIDNRADVYPIVSSAVTSTIGVDLLMRNGGKLTISADMPNIQQLQIGTSGTGEATVTHTAGTVTGSGSSWIGLGSGSEIASYSLSGSGALEVRGDLFLQARGILTLNGSSASLSVGDAEGDDLILSGNGELEFVLAADGIIPIDVHDSFTVDPATSLLTIDASGISEVEGTYELVSFNSSSGTFAASNITVEMPAGFDGVVTYDADSMNLEVSVVPGRIFENEGNPDLDWSSESGSPDGIAMIGQGVTVTLDVDGEAGTVQVKGTLKFELDTLGTPTLTLKETPTFEDNGMIEIDISKYEAYDRYFPLIYGSNLDSNLINFVRFIGDDTRQAAVVVQDDGLWLRLLAPPAFSDQIGAAAPDSTVASDYTDSIFRAERTLNLSGSPWQKELNEAQVMDTLLQYEDLRTGTNKDLSWDLRIGAGGQIYSFRLPDVGETVPPQSYGALSPWIDSVWQGVAVDQELNRGDYKYFIHQAGRYGSYGGPNRDEHVFSTMVSSVLDETNRSLTTINWGIHAVQGLYNDNTTENDWRSDVLFYNRYRDLGNGLIEVSLGCYNYGQDTMSYINLPFGGIRRDAFEYGFVSNSDGTWSQKQATALDITDTAGWVAFSDSQDGTSSTMGVVFGLDSSPSPELPPNRNAFIHSRNYINNGGDPEGDPTEWRNGHQFTSPRSFNLTQGQGVWCRYYFVLGDDVNDIADRIEERDLISSATLSTFDYTEDSTPLIGYRMTGNGGSFQIQEDSQEPHFFLYAHPIPGSFPIYEIIENDATRHITGDPYATGVIDPNDGTIVGMRLLGFAVAADDDTPVGINSGQVLADDLFTSLEVDYFPSEESLLLRMDPGEENPITAYAQSVLVLINGSMEINLSSSVGFASYHVVDDPTSGVLSGTNSDLVYTPAVDYEGSDSFTFYVSDSFRNSELVTVEIDVVDFADLVTIERVTTGTGYDISQSEAVAFRSTGIAKTYDMDGDNAYGTEGYVFFSTGSGTGSFDFNTYRRGGALWLDSIDAGTDYENSSQFGTYADFDNPGANISPDVADWIITGYARSEVGAGGTWAELITFRVGDNTPETFRLGVLAGNFHATTIDPSGIRLSVNGSVPVEATGLSTDVGMVFFDVSIPDGVNATFSLEAQRSGANQRTAIAGITFDAPPIGFQAWTIDYPSLVNTSIDGDPDNDRIENLLEYVLNGDPTEVDLLILPELDATGDNFVFSFTRRVESPADTTQVFQYSTTLQANEWTDVSITDPKAAEVTIGSVVNGLQAVSVTISKGIVGEGRLFGRLKVKYLDAASR